MVISFFILSKELKAKKNNRFAIVIPARNEKDVIGNLLECLLQQDYPQDKMDIYLLADNCTDCTAQIGRDKKVLVYERFNKKLIGKGYALTEFFNHINSTIGIEAYDGYFIFDSDNILEPDYISKINAVFDNGYNIVTGYRNSKNFGQNWVSSGSAIWFLRDCTFMNKVRMRFSTTSNVTGTGFVVASNILKERGGWGYHLMTEDIEFSVDRVIAGDVIGYAHDAIFYDEQPTSIITSWKQRKRWVHGFYQVLLKYWKELFSGSFIKGDFGIYDMFMLVAPGNAFTIVIIAVNFIFFLVGLVDINNSVEVLYETGLSMLIMLRNVMAIFFVIGMATVISEWKRIKASFWQKIKAIFTFPFYMFTYIPISIQSLFCRPNWEPIKHTSNKKISDMH